MKPEKLLAADVVRCCICGKTLREVSLMVTSERGISICDECVDVAMAMVLARRIELRDEAAKK